MPRKRLRSSGGQGHLSKRFPDPFNEFVVHQNTTNSPAKNPIGSIDSMV